MEDLAINVTVPTVPFSLTLGYGSSWNGSVIFGEYFDKNHVLAEKWTPTEETPGGNRTLLSTGKQSVGLVSICKYTFEGVVPNWQDTAITPATPFGHSRAGEAGPNHNAILDFNSDTIALPYTDYCGSNITISLNPGFVGDSTYSELQIALPAELTSSDKCISTSDTVVVGKPFFQRLWSMWMMVGTSISMWPIAGHSQLFSMLLIRMRCSLYPANRPLQHSLRPRPRPSRRRPL